MFKFDFIVEADGECIDQSKESFKSEITSPIIEWNDSEEVNPTEEILESLDVCRLNSTHHVFGDVTLSYMASGSLLQNLTLDDEIATNIKVAERNHSDLIPGIYEGGAKIWECSTDLLVYISNNCKSNAWQGLRVLDLGCGTGVLGIYAYKFGAFVQFQDYNKDVLERITIPNVLLNIAKPLVETDLNLSKLKTEVEFYSGDWSKYNAKTKDHEQFDVILTSETIYNPENQQKLLDTFGEKLKKNGFVLLAAKTYYFGVGGGLRQFENLIQNDKRFESKILWSSLDGVSREVMELKWK